ncbi:MAG: hypothetical protein WCN88_05405, partial [Candidatus Falkowbacteria bacterium]
MNILWFMFKMQSSGHKDYITNKGAKNERHTKGFNSMGNIDNNFYANINGYRETSSKPRGSNGGEFYPTIQSSVMQIEFNSGYVD